MTEVVSKADPAIIVQNLVKRFDTQSQNALDNLNTTIQKGTITGLVGPDGAGKTTLLRTLIGLLTPTAGDVYINGFNPVTHPEALRSFVGYMPQKFGLYEDLTVMENLTLYADLRNVTGVERDQSFENLLEFTDLKRFTKRFAGKLSGGMKQKLGLACVLLGSPEILLLDEPSVGVDPISRQELWRIVKKLVREGITVVWSTSYLDEAEACDEVRLMADGQILASGTPQALMAQMSGRCWQIIDIDGNRRAVLQKALNAPEVIDGTIQGKHVRIILRDLEHFPALES